MRWTRELRLNPWVTFVSVGVIGGFLLLGVLFPGRTGLVFERVQELIVTRFGWFYVGSVGFFLFFTLFLFFSPFGRVRLGPDDAKPDYSYGSWFAMLFSAGMGIGLVFFGVAEPILHWTAPPSAELGTARAASDAMRITLFHWGLHAWAIYIVVGLSLAYFSFRKGLPLAIRSAFHPVLGDRIHGPFGNAVDILAVFGTMFGVATSLGIGVMQVNAGLAFLFDIPIGTGIQIALIAGITLVATISVVLGLFRGIRRLSLLNMALALGLLTFVFLAGSTVFLLDVWVENVGNYLQGLVGATFRVNAWGDRSWHADWTLFYWGWWIAWSPFVGMFIARISRGRTIREFIAGVLLVPTLLTTLWVTVFGGSALEREMAGEGGVAGVATEEMLFALLGGMPLSALTSAMAVLVVITFFVTSSDSGSLVIDMLASGGNPDPPKVQRVFWALMEGAVASVLLLAGGLAALQTAAITTGLPFACVLLVMCFSLLKALRAERAGWRRPSVEAKST